MTRKDQASQFANEAKKQNSNSDVFDRFTATTPQCERHKITLVPVMKYLRVEAMNRARFFAERLRSAARTAGPSWL